ncbi:MFS transporter [Chitinophaga lutea]|uniref:MFS transporter n=1 Tax=Chitinophaga lutea TaxID=2488634 RepID=A0A3N4PP95_9BACT|nr:MFS transporter [Chitinophaga lutea]RPE09585.1 MFS transporter [Chitinophaga lutea]
MANKWQVRLAVSAFFFLNGLCFASWASRIPAIQASLHLTEAALGAVLFCIPVGSLASLPFSGWLITRTGSRQVMIAASLLYIAALNGIGIAPNAYALGAVLFCFGFIGNMGNISINTQAVGVEGLFGQTIMSSFHATWSMAGFAGALIGTLMASLRVPPATHFAYVGLAALLIVLAAFRFTMRQERRYNNQQPVFVKPDKFLIRLGVIAFCCMICEGTMYEWSGVYFAKVVKADPGLVTVGYTAFTLATTSGRFVGDWLARRYGIAGMLLASGILTAAGLLLAVLFPMISTSAAGFFLVGLGVSTVIPLVYSEAGKSTTMAPGMALAAVSSVGFLGFLTGPPVIGFIAQAAGLRASFTLIAAIGLMITFLAKRKPAKDTL